MVNDIRLRLDDRAVLWGALSAVLVAIAVLGAADTTALPACPSGCKTAVASAPDAAKPSPAPAVVTLTPGPHAREFDPLGRVSVTAASGQLADVQMSNDAGNCRGDV
jgi:hypothetical protein